MSEQADGDEIDTGVGVGANIFQTNSAGAFQGNSALEMGAALDGAANVFGRHVIEEDGFGAMRERILEILGRAHFYLDGLRAATVANCTLEGGDNSAGESDVIVLDQDSIRKIESMILTAAAAYGVFVDHAQAGSGFASIENAGFRAGDGIDELAGHGGDAAHALHEIQDDALTGKNHARVVADDGDGLTFVQTHTIENFGMRGDFVMRSDGAIEGGVNVEDAGDAADAGENAILFGENGGGGALVGIDAGVAGGVAGGAVLEQRVLNDRSDASAVEVHKTTDGCQILAIRSRAIQGDELVLYFLTQTNQFLSAPSQTFHYFFRSFREELFVA